MSSNMADHVDMLNRYDDLITVTPKYEIEIANGREIQYFHLPTYQSLFEECATMDDKRFKEWLATKWDSYSALAQTCREYRRWSTSKRSVRDRKLRLIRRERFASIIRRLEADGWVEELNDYRVMDKLRKHKLIRQSKALTDRIWKNIRPTLTMVVADGRAMLVAERIRTAIARRMALLERECKPLLARMSEHQANPSPSMIPYLEPFFGIIKNTPLERDIGVADFSEALVSLPETCATWRQHRDADLKKILLENGRNTNLHLAANAFTCTASDCLSSPAPVLHYPHFASHACFVRCVLMGENEDTLVNVWNPNAIAPVTKDAYDQFERMVRMCGLNPAVATTGDMDDVKAFFTCEDSCEESTGNSRLLMMDWRYAMGHLGAHPHRLMRVNNPRYISVFERLEAADLKTDARWCDDPFVCVHCGVTDLASRRERCDHLFRLHNIVDVMNSGNHFRRSSKSGHTSRYFVQIEDNPL